MEIQEEIRRRSRRRRLLAARRYRSRRFWRSISRRRRWVGLLALLVLVGGLASAYYFTRPARVKVLAEKYLTDLTGMAVVVGDAHFSPFEGIRLEKLTIRPRRTDAAAEPEPPVFQADEVLLELEFGSLLGGKLDVRRIVAVRPKMVRRGGDKDGSPGPAEGLPVPRDPDIRLPEIDIREGELTLHGRLFGSEPQVWHAAITAQLLPDPQSPRRYRVTGKFGRGETGLPPLSGTITLDSGFRIQVDADLVITRLQQLPRQIETLLDDYGISGLDPSKVVIEGNYDSEQGELTLRFLCEGTGLKLPLGRFGQASDDPDAPDPGPLVLTLSEVQGLVTVQASLAPTTQPDGGAEQPWVGRIAFGDFDPQSRTVVPLRGLVDGQPLEVNGEYLGFSADAPFQMHFVSEKLDLPTDPALIARMPRLVRQIWENYGAPTGTAGLRIDVTRDRGERPRISGTVTCIDVAGSFWRYPYRVEHTTGTIRFAEDEATLDLTCRSGGTTVTVKGTTGFAGNRSLDLRIVGRDIPVDERAMAALSVRLDQYVQVLRKLQVQGGTVGFDCRATRQNRPDAPYGTELTLSLDGVGMRFEEFDYPLRVVKGTAQYIGDGMRFRDMELVPTHLLRKDPESADPNARPTYDPSAVIMADGFVRRIDPEADSDAGGAEVRLDVVSAALPLNETLWRALPPEAARVLAEYHIDARARVVGWVHKRPGSPLDFDLHGVLHGGYMRYEGFPYALESLAGRVRVTPQRVELIDARAQHGIAEISVVGQVGIARPEPTRLTIRSDRVPLDEDLYAALSPQAQETWRLLSPTGQVALDVKLAQEAAPPPPAPDAIGRPADAPPTTQPESARPPMTTVVTVTALGNGITYEEFPYPLKRVTGQAVIRPDRIDLIDLSDVDGERSIRLSGTIWPGRDNMNLGPGQPPLPRFELDLTAERVAFNETLRRAVPWQIRRRWNDILPAGQFDLRLKQLRHTPLGATSRWDFDGHMDIRNGRGLLGIELERLNGQVVGAGSLVVGSMSAFVGQVTCTSATVAGRPMTELSGKLTLDPRTGLLRIDGFTGKLYGGQVGGFAEMGLDQRDLPYSLSLSGRDIDLGELVNQDRPADGRWDVTGRLEGRFAVTGKIDGDRRGGGELQLSRARIYQLPPILQMLGPAQAARDGANQSASIVFYLDGKTVQFEQANVRDPSLSLLGAGTMSLPDNQLDLVFIAGEPSRGGSAGARLLEELLSGAGEELMRYHVTGPVGKPKVEAVPLHTVREAIEELVRARRRFQPPGRQAGQDKDEPAAIQPGAPGQSN